MKKNRRGRRRDESQEEETRAESADASLVSAGLRDLLGMNEWRKQHPKATLHEVAALGVSKGAVSQWMKRARMGGVEEVTTRLEQWLREQLCPREDCLTSQS